MPETDQETSNDSAPDEANLQGNNEGSTSEETKPDEKAKTAKEIKSEALKAEKTKPVTLTGMGFNFFTGRSMTGQVSENLAVIGLNAGQRGNFISTDKGYVLERVDIHVIEKIEKKVSLEVETESGKCIARFTLSKDGVKRESVTGQLEAGTLLEHEKLFLKNVSKTQDLSDLKGRICLIIRGYKAETWR